MRQCIRPVCGALELLALMEAARIDPHKTLGHVGRFFNQAGDAPVDGCAISQVKPRSTGWVSSVNRVRPLALDTADIAGCQRALSSRSVRACWPAPRQQRCGGVRVSRALSHAPRLDRSRAKHVYNTCAPWMKSRRRWTFPRLLIEPRVDLPPVENCRGTRPSQAAISRPRLNIRALPTAATVAVAMIGPIPGTVAMFWHNSDCAAC